MSDIIHEVVDDKVVQNKEKQVDGMALLLLLIFLLCALLA